MPPSVSRRTSRPPAPSTIVVPSAPACVANRSAYSLTRGIGTPARRAAVSGASGSSSRVHSSTEHPVNACTTSASLGEPSPTPVCTGFTTVTGPGRVAARAAVAIVLPTPVPVPVTTMINRAP